MPAVAARLAPEALPDGQSAVVVMLPRAPAAGALPTDPAMLIALADLAVAVPTQYARQRVLTTHSRASADAVPGADPAAASDRDARDVRDPVHAA